MHRLRVAGAVLTGLAVISTVTACGGDDKTDTGKPVVIDITIKDGKVDPSGDRIDVGAGQPVDLVVTADEAGSLHMHSDPEQQFDYAVGTSTFKLEIDRPGVIAVESHELDQIIVQLEVR